VCACVQPRAGSLRYVGFILGSSAVLCALELLLLLHTTTLLTLHLCCTGLRGQCGSRRQVVQDARQASGKPQGCSSSVTTKHSKDQVPLNLACARKNVCKCSVLLGVSRLRPPPRTHCKNAPQSTTHTTNTTTLQVRSKLFVDTEGKQNCAPLR
jgi:hypothetical protein